ncbi:sugar-binding transcriptional regulator [Clostridium estertheticum]|uniref:Transcriptional regulator n=1 Tax=Clostridium estertheticum subsp. estertheticum TaxID=1552 RepID=A0A1J0GFZ1_9CLOT|nr:sugar-binding transcriptional regulator [Clostridium estertheticum]APC40207.1 transcriptional regulator [Clostridium estertheticum subsp. estertheticum]MBU3075216.1 sugar-binding transcriptional regulator [Clostridium estertheticum]MBU3165431.1 sugar-binding transcriptional regulator [Clostridium estertheticum]MBU3170437.1 sugar-binding transcriptional regulator [Clostridium estertheticum]MBX4261174.1 sugar-binding transcriptional regulator [Clostridium estertheticum]
MNDFDNMNENEKNSLLASVASLYYEHDMTQSQISERLFTSRSKISRLLKEARDKKIVEIIIKEPWERLMDIENEFIKRFKLKHVRIINTKGSSYELTLIKLGEIAAYYIDAKINKNTILGISWGNTIYNTVQSLKSNKNIPLTVVQIMGAALKDNPEIDGIDLVKQFAKIYGGKYHYLLAPLFVEDKDMKDKLIRDPYISDTLSLAKRATVILTSVGSIDSTISNTAWSKYIDSYTQYSLQSSGAVGHIGGRYYDINGKQIESELNNTIIGIDLIDFYNAPDVICVAGSKEKSKAILGAIRGKYIKTLIIDDTAALKILELDDEVQL